MSDDKNEIPEEAIKYIKKEMEQIGFGKVTIELNKKARSVDIISERRKRFEKKETPFPGMVPEQEQFREG